MGYYCGIDLGGTNIKAGIVDGEGKLLNKLSIKTRAERSMEEIIHDMGKLAADAIKDAGLEVKDIECIGIGSPGTPDNEEGLLVYSSNLPFNKAPMRKLIREVVDLPVYIDNDANCAAMAEAVAGAAKGAKDSVTTTRQVPSSATQSSYPAAFSADAAERAASSSMLPLRLSQE